MRASNGSFFPTVVIDCCCHYCRIDLWNGLMAPKNKNRDYEKEAKWAATKEQKLRRAERNRARREAEKKGLVRKGDGKEVHHTKGSRRGKLTGPTKVVSRKENRRIQPDRPGGKKK